MASDSDRVVERGKLLYPLAWKSDRVYVMDYPTGNPVQTYSIALATGQMKSPGARLIAVDPVSGGGAWSSEVSRSLPATVGQNSKMLNSVSRVDLASVQKVEWYSEANAALTVPGLAQDGTPLVQRRAAKARTIRLTGPGLAAETYSLGTAPGWSAATDQSGTWLVSSSGDVLLYKAGAAPYKVVSAPAGTSSVRVTGGCALR